MTVKSLDFQYQKTNNPLFRFYHPELEGIARGSYTLEDFREFPGWKANGERQEFVDIVPRMPSISLFKSPGEVKREYVTGQYKYVHTEIYGGPLRERGKWESSVENFRQRLLNFQYNEKGEPNPEVIMYIQFLYEKGLLPNLDITHIGVKDYKGRYGAAVILDLEREEAKLAIDKKHNSKSRIPDEFFEYVMLHEFTHLFGIRSERTVGLLLAEFYAARAKALQGTKQGKIYESLKERAIKYAERFSWLNQLIEGLKKDVKLNINSLEALVAEYTQEALEQGYNTEEGINNYIVSKLGARIKEYQAKQEGKDSEDSKKNDDNRERITALEESEKNEEQTVEETTESNESGE